MISSIAIFLYTVVLVAISFLYLQERYKLKNTPIKDILQKNMKYIIVTATIFILLIGVEIWYSLRNDLIQLPVLMKWSTLFWGIFLLAKVDFHEKKIPNQVVLVMLVLRCLFLVYEVLVNLDYWKNVITYPLLGAAVGGLILAVAMLISRKGVGMGDVKMFIVIGAFVGSTEIIATMFYTFLFSAIGGIGLLIAKKAGLKDSIPMAPFAFVGVAVEYLLLMIGG